MENGNGDESIDFPFHSSPFFNHAQWINATGRQISNMLLSLFIIWIGSYSAHNSGFLHTYIHTYRYAYLFSSL